MKGILILERKAILIFDSLPMFCCLDCGRGSFKVLAQIETTPQSHLSFKKFRKPSTFLPIEDYN